MMLMKSTIRTQRFCFRRQPCALLSTPADKIQRLTPDDIIAAEKKIESHKKHIRLSVYPFDLKAVSGGKSGDPLPANPAELRVFNGMPEHHANREVVISQKMNKTLQSGDKHIHQYTIVWKNSVRWTNPLMGWTSTSDPLASLRLSFDTREEAISFAERNGWKYELIGDTSKELVDQPAGTNKYQHNFLSRKLQMQIAEEGLKTKEFVNPKYGQSNFFMPLKYHGDGEVIQHGPSSK